jgi:hypothetical protein
MFSRRAPWLYVLLTITACSYHRIDLKSAAAPRPDPKSAAAPRPDALGPYLQKYCSDCHYQGSGKIALERPSAVSDTTGLRCALMLSARRMPPPPSQLPDADRSDMIKLLCERYSSSVPVCLAATGYHRRTVPVRTGDELIRDIRGAPTPSAPLMTEEEALRTILRPSESSLVLDPTFAVLSSMIIANRCTNSASSPVVQRGTFTECVKRYLRIDFLEVPPPLDVSEAR